MRRIINSIAKYLCYPTDSDDSDLSEEKHILDSESPKQTKPGSRNTQALAADILSLLSTAEYNDKHLEESLQDIVRETGWYEDLAAAVLNGLETIVRAGAPVAGAMTDAVDKATTAAIEFAKEHPVFCTIVALGVLVLLAPWVIEALGFGELGPIEGMLVVISV